jgi:peptide/nickel transport system permease protein
VLGTALGLVMGYFRGLTDDVLGRFVEAFLALPLVVTALIVVNALGHSDVTIIIVIGVVFTPLIARTVRSAVLQERELDYVAAARLRGEPAAYIMFVEILPNVMAPVMVEFTVRLGYAIFTVAILSFLGFGVQPPSPDWGLEIATNYGQVTAGYWWEVLFDALAIASLVIAVNLIADSIEKALER